MKKGTEFKNRFVDKIVLFGAIYTIGVLLGSIFYLFWALRRIKVLHWERFPRNQGKLIIIANHPSLLEPILLLALFSRDYIFHPFKFSPWSTPDKENYYDKWYCFWLRPRAVPIERNNEKQGLKTILELKNIINSGGIVIIFPEAGRTFKGQEFFYSQKGKKLRVFKEGIAWLVRKTSAPVYPVWVEGTEEVLPNLADRLYHTYPRFWKKVTIKIGNPLRFEKREDKESVLQTLIIALLNLADEPC